MTRAKIRNYSRTEITIFDVLSRLKSPLGRSLVIVAIIYISGVLNAGHASINGGNFLSLPSFLVLMVLGLLAISFGLFLAKRRGT